ncbi:MAG: alpha/beta fold hydrolase, partial [Planctomycetota bacterium]
MVIKRSIDIGDAALAYRQAGDPAAPACILLHGVPTSSALWHRVLPLIAGQRFCLAPDLAGLGETHVHNRHMDLSIPGQARMIADFLCAKGVHRADIVGHDLGGAVALQLAAHRPGLVRSLVLANCTAYDNWPVPALRRIMLLAGNRLGARLLVQSGLLELKEYFRPV